MLADAFGISPDHADFPILRDEFFSNYEKALLVESRLFDGIDHLLVQMDHANLLRGIITNKSERFTKTHYEVNGSSPASRLHCSNHTQSPFCMQQELRISILHNQSMFGNDIRDILAGNAAGMKTVAAAYGYCRCKGASRGLGSGLHHQ
ncbi:HAD family hydrolase [Polynucleobacter necessarius]|uniref:HAD family hydrolase n=1 Tax=Polynucleobacter necessarius TaxID=576610 RepID=UPI0013B067F7|nr:HAD hydrolase-like protein [Polynucleobacter necessarius]